MTNEKMAKSWTDQSEDCQVIADQSEDPSYVSLTNEKMAKSLPDHSEERQLDITLLVDQYQQILLSLTAKPEVSLATLIEGISLLTPTLQVSNSLKPEAGLATGGAGAENK